MREVSLLHAPFCQKYLVVKTKILFKREASFTSTAILHTGTVIGTSRTSESAATLWSRTRLYGIGWITRSSWLRISWRYCSEYNVWWSDSFARSNCASQIASFRF